MEYKYCGHSGLQLPRISLGLWHNFGDVDDLVVAREMICYAFDQGVTHFDLANNYGTPVGSAEVNFGKIVKRELKAHRDQMIIASKAGHAMWAGPYGDGGSRKYMIASIDQSLKRTGLDYFDIFYTHRYDPQTPLEETMLALVDMVRQGKALYIGISKYPVDRALEAYEILKSHHIPCLIHQDKYSMLERKPEQGLLDLNVAEGVGFIGFSPLAQGLLTDKYLGGIPATSRAGLSHGYLKKEVITSELISKFTALNDLAHARGQSLAEMALAWVLANKGVTSVIVGTSSVRQIKENLGTVDNCNFDASELVAIDDILSQ